LTDAPAAGCNRKPDAKAQRESAATIERVLHATTMDAATLAGKSIAPAEATSARRRLF
jgi:hypothetical protein